MKLPLPPLIHFILLAALLTACKQQADTADTQPINEYLVNLSDRMNKRLPDMADENTVLEATSGKDRQFTHFYTLLNYTAGEIDANAFTEQMKPALVQNTCTSTTLSPLISRDVTIRYVYADKDRKEFATVSVGPDEC